MRLSGMHAGHEGVETPDAVCKPLFFKKIKGAVGNGGLVAVPLGGEAAENLVGAHRPVVFEQDLQHPPAHRRQADAAAGDQRLCPGHGIGLARGMIMRRKGQIGRVATRARDVLRLHEAAPDCYKITFGLTMLCYYSNGHRVVNLKARLMRLAALLCLLPFSALAAPPLVVTDIPPVHALTAQVMAGLGAPVLLLAPGADEHDFQLRPSQMRDIEGAGLIVWIGPELTPWLDRASAGAPAARLGLLAAPGTTNREFPEAPGGGHGDGPDAEGDHDAAEEHSGIDPHVWLNPQNAVVWLPLIAAELSRLDPANAARYAENARAAAAEIATLDAAIAASLAPARTLPFVSQHDAYGHFIDHYGLTFAGSIADGEAADPGAAHLSDLRARLEAGEVRCLFPEVQHDPAQALQLVEGTPVRLGGALDPVGSALEPGPGAYAQLLLGIAGTLGDCLLP